MAETRATPRQKAWLARLRPRLPDLVSSAQGYLDLRPAGPPLRRTYSVLYPFTVLEDGRPYMDILVKVPQGRKAADVHRTFRAYQWLHGRWPQAPAMQVPVPLATWEDPPALIMRRAPGDPLVQRLQDCRSWRGDVGCQLALHFVEQAGRWLALLHQTPPPSWSQLATDPLASREDWLRRLRTLGLDPLEERQIRQLIQPLSPLAASSPVPLHGDYTLRNILCHPPHQVTVLDTELAWQGDPAQDIGSFLAALHFIDKWQILGGEAVYPHTTIRRAEEAFLQGYASIRVLPDPSQIRGWMTWRLLERWLEFVEREHHRGVAGWRTLTIRRINQHFTRTIRKLDESSKKA